MGLVGVEVGGGGGKTGGSCVGFATKDLDRSIQLDFCSTVVRGFSAVLPLEVGSSSFSKLFLDESREDGDSLLSDGGGVLERTEDLDGVEDELKRWTEVGSGRASVFLVGELENLRKERRSVVRGHRVKKEKRTTHQDNRSWETRRDEQTRSASCWIRRRVEEAINSPATE